MSQDFIVPGRYCDHQFIPDGPLPDTEGSASLVITPVVSSEAHSVFDLFGKAAQLRTSQEIEQDLRSLRDEWGTP